MTHSFTKWGKYHKQYAKEHLLKNSKQKLLPSDIIDWMKYARPRVENHPRNFLVCPFWLPIYNDQHNYQMIMGGRQIFKSTACTDFIAHAATTQPGIQVCYVTYDQQNLSGFSKQKLKIGTFLVNPILSKFLRYPGNIGEMSLNNNSTIYLTTDNYQYRHVEGKSPALCILDEAQYQDLEHVGRVHQTMMATKGKLKIFGIGGEANSPYEKLWNDTNQMELFYDNPNWRERLQFDQNGLVIEDYLKEELRCKWIPQNPNAESFHGYHIPQTILPTMPLTEDDAINKYHIHQRFSIEYQKKTLSESQFRTYVMGTFHNSQHRPVTRKMIEDCTKDNRNLSLLTDNELYLLKEKYGDKITIAMGIDFGSGSSGSTVIAILILWHVTKRVQIAFVDKRSPENQMKQAQFIAELFKKCSCDVGVGDLGYGAIQIKIIQDGGHSIDTGAPFEGVSNNNFYGCRSISDETKPFQIFGETTDEHGDQVGRIQIDKASGIEFLIETMENFVLDPQSPNEKTRPKLIIPSKYDYEIDFLVKDLLSITRKDLQDVDKIISDPRQRTRKVYSHPGDSVMALVYAITALKVKEQTAWFYVSN